MCLCGDVLPGQFRARSVLKRVATCLEIVALDVTGDICPGGKPKSAGKLERAHPPWQLQQSERVAVGLGHDAIADAVVESARDGPCQEGPRVLVAQAANLQLRQPVKLLSSLPRREHEADRLRKQPSGDERERACRSLIQPLRVVHYAQR